MIYCVTIICLFGYGFDVRTAMCVIKFICKKANLINMLLKLYIILPFHMVNGERNANF